MSTACKPYQQAASLTVSYSSANPDTLLADDNTLAVIDFSEQSITPGNPYCYQTGTPVLDQGYQREVWRCSGPIESGRLNDCQWTASDQHLFAGIYISAQKNAEDYKLAAQAAYLQLLQSTRTLGFNYLYKVWNYLPALNKGEGDLEHYKQFCLGRHEAFTQAGFHKAMFPSACALGNKNDTSVIYLLAGKQPGTHFENPLQTAAYNYPRQYGPRSPSFARATMAHFGTDTKLILSGTASVIGHESRHAEDFDKQLLATTDNIEALLEHIKNQAGLARVPMVELLKVYLRNPQDLPVAQSKLAAHFGESTPTVFLHADICRSELLVEIEGICQI